MPLVLLPTPDAGAVVEYGLLLVGAVACSGAVGMLARAAFSIASGLLGDARSIAQSCRLAAGSLENLAATSAAQLSSSQKGDDDLCSTSSCPDPTDPRVWFPFFGLTRAGRSEPQTSADNSAAATARCTVQSLAQHQAPIALTVNNTIRPLPPTGTVFGRCGAIRGLPPVRRRTSPTVVRVPRGAKAETPTHCVLTPACAPPGGEKNPEPVAVKCEPPRVCRVAGTACAAAATPSPPPLEAHVAGPAPTPRPPAAVLPCNSSTSPSSTQEESPR